MNSDAVKIQQPVATTVYANVPVDTAMLATNIYGQPTQLAAPAATHIPLIATTAGPQPPHHQALQVAPAPGQHQPLIAAHTAAPHTQQHSLQTVQAAAAAAAVAAATPQPPQAHQVQGHPQQPHIQYAHQAPMAAAAGQGPTVTTTTIDNTEYTVMNGTIAQDGTVVCYSQDELISVGVGPPGAANLVAVDQMSGTPVASAATQQHNAHAQHHVILTNVPPPPAQQQQQQSITQPHQQQQQHHHQPQQSQQHVVGGANNNTNNMPANSSSNASSNSSGNTGGGAESNTMSLEQLKQSLATQLEYYFSRYVGLTSVDYISKNVLKTSINLEFILHFLNMYTSARLRYSIFCDVLHTSTAICKNVSQKYDNSKLVMWSVF